MKEVKHVIPKWSEEGQALVEFAVISVILLMLAGGVIDGIRVIRCHIVMNGAVTEIANRITIDTATEVERERICREVINGNYYNELGDGNTFYKSTLGDKVTGNIIFTYHDSPYSGWRGNRDYTPITTSLEREMQLFTPFGRLIFGNSSGETKRRITTVAVTRVYMN